MLMLRERVDVHGVVRPMEPMEEIAALKVRPQEIGIIKEGPLNKWWSGQKEWDRKYRRSAERAIKKRKKMENEAKRVLDNARDQGLLMVHEELEAQARETLAPPTPARNVSNMSTLSRKSVGRIQNDRRWGPLDLGSENVPASAIAGRRDTVCFYCSCQSFVLTSGVGRSCCTLEEVYLLFCTCHALNCTDDEGLGHDPGRIRPRR